jgi:hypothetical protein
MSQVKDGGSVLPVPSTSTQTGMSLRDYFAAMVVQGMLSRSPYPSEDAAKIAYKTADAMLQARDTK